MIEDATIDLEKLGRDAAEHVAALGAVEFVAAEPILDTLDEPAYRFSFMVDQNWKDWPQGRGGQILIRLGGKLRDELIMLGDERYPLIQLLSPSDLDAFRSA